jgi:ubiquinone biosynthesis protein
MLEIAQQTAKSLVVRSIGGEDIRNALISGFMDTADIAKSLPGILARFLKKAEETDFVFELKIKEMEKIEKRMEHVFNRMSFGIILLSISIVLSGIIIAIGAFGNSADGGALYSISTVALVAGLVAAGTIVVGMILSILLSGRRK